MMKRILVAALLLGAIATPLAAQGAGRRRAVEPSSGWSVPQCTSISGLPSVSMSLDGGRSVLRHEETDLDVQVYTFGLAALRRPNSLLAITSRFAVTSTDGGCNWTMAGFTFPEQGYEFVDDGTQLRAWSQLHPQIFPVADDGTIGAPVTAPVATPLRLHADRNVDGRLTIVDFEGGIWRSEDGGKTWLRHGASPSRAPLYAAVISSRGRAHIATSGLADGVQVTFDGGASWHAARGLEGHNVFRLAFSPIDPDTMWAVAIDPLATGHARRGIFLSRDGGRSFERVLAGSADIAMTNGFTITPSPVDRDQLYFALPGTLFYRIDDRGTVLERSRLPHRDINAIVFSPASNGILYFGLKLSDMS